MTNSPETRNGRRRLAGSLIALPGDDIDTDQIIPARFLKGVTFAGLGEYAFADVRSAAKARGDVHPFDDPKLRNAQILLVNKNFGCGSSREHAPQALHRWGITAIVGESFGEIFTSNCLAIGMPCLDVSTDGLSRLQDAARAVPRRSFVIDLENKTIIGDDLAVPVELTEGARIQFIEGTWDATTVLLEAKNAIKRTTLSLPYLNNWL